VAKVLRSIFSASLTSLAIVSLALALCEIGIRAFDLGPSFQLVYRRNFQLSDNAVLDYELKAGSQDGPQVINSAGFRDREFPIPREEGAFRIAAIGDSVTYGHECAQEAAYPKQLERLLNAAAGDAAPRYEVLNFGVTGYNIPQVVERLRVLALDYQPDVILYGYVLNDPQAFSFEGGVLRDSLAEREHRFREVTGGGLARAMARSRLFLWARHLYAVEAPKESTLKEPQQDPGMIAAGQGRIDRYFRSLYTAAEPSRRFSAGMAELASLAGARGIPVLVAIFPLFLTSEGEYPFADLHALVADEARRNGFRALDLLPAFEAAAAGLGGEISLNFLHPNALGYRVAASALLLWLDALELPHPGAVDLDHLMAGDRTDASIAALLLAGAPPPPPTP
jgi:lysophospholipase L1-like esterase